MGSWDEPLRPTLVPDVHPVPVVPHQKHRFPSVHRQPLLPGPRLVLLHNNHLLYHGVSVGVGEGYRDILVVGFSSGGVSGLVAGAQGVRTWGYWTGPLGEGGRLRTWVCVRVCVRVCVCVCVVCEEGETI